MSPSIIDNQSEPRCGFIHFNCFCGLDIYCFGRDDDGNVPLKAITQFRRLLGEQPAAIFSAADGATTNCPDCDITIELPSSEVIALFAERETRVGARRLQIDNAVLPGTSTSTPV